MKNEDIIEVVTIQTANKETFDYMVNYNLKYGLVIKELKEKNSLFTCILVKYKPSLLSRFIGLFKL